VRRPRVGWRSVGARALSSPFFLAVRKKGIRDAKEMGTKYIHNRQYLFLFLAKYFSIRTIPS
jgi:hypothetical protein